MITYKVPKYENDSLYMVLEDFDIMTDQFDDYTNFKLEKFQKKDISRSGVDQFRRKPSFSNDNVKYFRNTIYTYTVERENYVEHEKALQQVKTLLELKSRRAVIRFANSLDHYFNSAVYNDVDVTCLSLIHYIRSGKFLNVKLIFRALDLENEALTDLITIYMYFIEPIVQADDIVTIEIIASTVQNIEHLTTFAESIKKLCHQNS